MAVKRAEWIAERRFHGKEERMEATSSRLFFKSCCLCSPFNFCGEKRLHFMHFEPPFCFIVVLGSQKKIYDPVKLYWQILNKFISLQT